jgi:hypothetical protein
VPNGLDDIEVFFSWDPKNPINALILEGGGELIRSFEHALSPVSHANLTLG